MAVSPKDGLNGSDGVNDACGKNSSSLHDLTRAELIQRCQALAEWCSGLALADQVIQNMEICHRRQLEQADRYCNKLLADIQVLQQRLADLEAKQATSPRSVSVRIFRPLQHRTPVLLQHSKSYADTHADFTETLQRICGHAHQR